MTEEEQAWLAEHEGQIRIGYTTDYPPVEFLISDEYIGISADYFKLLETKLNTRFEMVRFDQWSDLIEAARKKEVSGITAATKTPERSTYLDFTVPYIMNPNVIITRKNFSEKLTFEKLSNSSMDILVIEEYSIVEYLEENHPKLEFRTVPNTSDGLRLVSFGEADALIVEVMSASAEIEKDKITNLMVNTEIAYDSNLSIATRSDWPMLSAILNKGLAQITEAEKKYIQNKWVPLQRKSIVENRFFWIGLGVVLFGLSAIIVMIMAWNRLLKKAVLEKTEELRYKSYHDELTGLYNRTYYSEQLEYFERSKIMPLSIVLADLNGLKITNDTLGHEIGDQLLKKIAEILKSNCSESDSVARIGGDEFVVLMPGGTDQMAQALCNKIKIACDQAKMDPIKLSVALGHSERVDLDQSLQSVFKKAEDQMYENKMYESESTHTGILDSLKAMLRDNTEETTEHSRRMEEMALQLGELIGLTQPELNALSSLADLHDLGKVAISDKILLKEGPLTEEEMEKVRRHPNLGYKIAGTSPKLTKIAEGILSHHEWWDGNGYPRGLKGQEIPILARIISLVDAFDVMTSGRPYKSA
ncbi:MAG: transporter substrate-binding domain-containing protein, partial [Bacillota bacterium]|nr:transporter substrate-binding domain-containing protein [Bacillota bacterium]